MRVIKIEESKVDKMSDYAEKMLKYGGKLMHCIEELSDGYMGEREDDDDEEEDFGMRGGMGNRGGRMGERRMRSGRTGRYM